MIKFIKENFFSNKNKGINISHHSNEQLSTIGNNENYYLLSQVELNKGKL